MLYDFVYRVCIIDDILVLMQTADTCLYSLEYRWYKNFKKKNTKLRYLL